MTAQITPEALEFLAEAKENFSNIETTTYTSKEKGFIALRTGFREDNIHIYELDGEIGIFTEQLPSQHTVIVDYDNYNFTKKKADNYDKLMSVLDLYAKQGNLSEEFMVYMNLNFK